MSNTLNYFRVDGSWRDVEEHIPSESGIAPQIDDVSAYIDFFPGTQAEAIPQGLALLVPDYETYGDTELALAPITGRTINARLCTIAIGDPTGIELVDEATWMGFDEPLFYHVRYRNVTYGGAVQRFSNFAFQAPGNGAGVLLTSRDLERFEYRGP
jgi:hypothetical protein